MLVRGESYLDTWTLHDYQDVLVGSPTSSVFGEFTQRWSIVDDCLCAIRPVGRPHNKVGRAELGSNHVCSQARGRCYRLNAELRHVLRGAEQIDSRLSLSGIL